MGGRERLFIEEPNSIIQGLELETQFHYMHGRKIWEDECFASKNVFVFWELRLIYMVQISKPLTVWLLYQLILLRLH